ncbi:unnamed protein product [Rotaria socialis]|uniref:Uncharacterized protein n=1 Tax=Rotaria socialis TaxID=392032 RepID=A0A817TKP0_9BILA|nr:unnamed protein product [Rotaria socialis]
MENTVNNELCLLAHGNSGYIWCEPPSSELGYGQELQGPQHQPHQKKKKCHGNRKLQRFRRKCHTRGAEEKSIVMLPKMAENARQIHEHNEASFMGNVNTNSILLTSSTRKPTYHQIPNINMNSTTNKSSIPTDKWKTSRQLIPNYLKMSSRLFMDLLCTNLTSHQNKIKHWLIQTNQLQCFRRHAELLNNILLLEIEQDYWDTITDSVPIEIIWLSNMPKDTTRINSINLAYPRTIENLNKRQTIIQNKLKHIQHQFMIHLKEESLIAQHSISKSIDLLNLIDTAIRQFVHQGQQRLRTMYGEQKLIFEFDTHNLRLVKSLYNLNPTNEQLLHVQKLWRSKVKACKPAIQQCHDNSSLHNQPNTEVNTDKTNENEICLKFTNGHLYALQNQLKEYQQELNIKANNYPGYTLSIQEIIKTYLEENLNASLYKKIQHQVALIHYDYHIRALELEYFQHKPNEYQKQLMKQICQIKYEQETSEQEYEFLKQQIAYYTLPSQSFECSTTSHQPSIDSVQNVTIRTALMKQFKEVAIQSRNKLFNVYLESAEDQREEYQKKHETNVKKINASQHTLNKNEKLSSTFVQLINERCNKISERIRYIYKFKSELILLKS